VNKEQLVALNKWVQQCFPGGVIAGGVVRDLVNGVEQKDIDIFVPYMGHERNGRVATFADGYSAQFYQEPFHYITEEVATVWGVDADYIPLPIQIIEMANGYVPMDRVRLMDFGICQFWLDEDGLVTGTAAAWDDTEMNTFTLLRPESDGERARSMRRWDRLSQKYPGYQLKEALFA
jgi:hypothetical protein